MEPRLTTVADIAGKHGRVTCRGDVTLREAAALLVATGRTAAAVVDELGVVTGAFTENDVLRAYRSDSAWECSLDEWLRGAGARLPRVAMSMLTVEPTMGLAEAAARMRELPAAAGEFASRHLVVLGAPAAASAAAGAAALGNAVAPSAAAPAAPPRTHGSILSALDVARAICSTPFGPEVAGEIGGSRVSEVMKPKSMLPLCPDTATMEEALDRMLFFRQNCVLVTDPDDTANLVGVVTTRDALIAFSEGIPLNVLIGHWMFCFGSSVSPRLVEADVPLVGAAAKMSHACLHHLVVVAPGTEEVIGVISSLDLARAIGCLAGAADEARQSAL